MTEDLTLFPKANILAVDDSEAIRSNIKQILNDSGLIACCHEARTGLEAMKVLLEKEIDLVICDVVMPEMDGPKFLSLKKQHPRLNEIPVIMLTSKEDVALNI